MDSQPIETLASPEFTYDWYRSLLDWFTEREFTFRPFAADLADRDVLLRHDVDLSLEKAVTMARIEAERDIRATYCVLLTSPLYNPLERTSREKLRAIDALGHDIALHFSTHEYWDAETQPDDEALTDRIDQELDVIGTMVDRPETVSFHVPPTWVLGRSFEGFENAYGPTYFTEAGYLADSGQRWRDVPPVVPDPPPPLQILTHPGLWGETDGDFEARIEWAIARACDHADRKAHLEFLQGATDR